MFSVSDGGEDILTWAAKPSTSSLICGSSNPWGATRYYHNNGQYFFLQLNATVNAPAFVPRNCIRTVLKASSNSLKIAEFNTDVVNIPE